MTLQKLNRRNNSSLNGFDSFFNDFFHSPSTLNNRSVKRTNHTKEAPPVNILELDKSFDISLAVPGMKRSDFNIEIKENKLTVSSKSVENKEEDAVNYSRREFDFTNFSRVFTLPENIVEEKVNAKYEDGILKVTIPKSKELKDKTTVVKIS